tara:strand:- start:314 stop:601 length:288 start_codon:yes stop_codon:yes gene_type:complete
MTNNQALGYNLGMSSNFKNLLDGYHDFPCTYMFKFVMPQDRIEELREIFETDDFETKESSKGKYISVTIQKYVISSDEVMSLYEQCSEIKGLFPL